MSNLVAKYVGWHREAPLEQRFPMKRQQHADHSRFWQRKVSYLCYRVSQCDTDVGTSQLGVMEDNLIALASNLLQQMKNSDSDDFKINK